MEFMIYQEDYGNGQAGYIETTGEYQTYAGSLVGESNKYKSKYKEILDATSENVDPNYDRKGEAIWEISNKDINKAWNNINTDFLIKNFPFFIRGSHWENTFNSAMFAFNKGNGISGYAVGFRVVVIVENGD